MFPCALVASVVAFCGNGDSSQFDGGGDATRADAPSDSPFGGGDVFTGPYNDFPPTPIIDTPDGGPAAPSNAPQLFGNPDAGAASGGPCLVEPEVGSLYPRNWLRPRFHWIAPGGENLFELRVHAANQVNDLLVYTAETYWTMPLAMWNGLRIDSNDQPMTVTVRGGVYASPTLSNIATGSSGPIGIAPVDAPGAIVYWTTTSQSLKGFSIGDETVVQVLVPSQVQNSNGCIGCHTATPDGLYAEMSDSNNWGNSIGSVQSNTVGQLPPFMTSFGTAALEQSPRGISTLSLGHWGPGDYTVVTMQNNADLTWVDLAATSAPTATGKLARTGDSRGAGAPAWSHDGNTIAYVSTNALVTGRLDNGAADLYTIPYNNRAGGTATAITGASDPAYEEYYPIYSPDDQLLAFDRIPNGNQMYNQPLAEVYVIPATGGTATRLAANDPPACSGKKSPGVTNSWPKWAPQASTASGGRTFYWTVFSSTRDENGNPQLYVSPVVVTGATVTTYQALYLWNQPAAENNHTPAWDVFKIPPPPVR